MSTVIDIRNLDFSYGTIPVLEDISVQIHEEEFFGVIGPNAAGKSSLLKVILGLVEPDQGAVSVLGQKPEKVRGRIGYVPQHPTFRRDFPITVAEVVRLGQLGRSQTAGAAAEAYAGAMEAVGIDTISNRRIVTLSGGQLQRVLIARALACQPEILILDEPTANIDLPTEVNIFGLLKQYNRRMTIIVVSHDIGFISDYVDRVGCLNRRMVCHYTAAISGKTIEELYGTTVKMIDHHHHDENSP